MSHKNRHEEQLSPYTYSIAGLRVFTNRPAYNLGVFTATDSTLSVWFTLQEIHPQGSQDPTGAAQSPPAWHRLPGPVEAPAFLSDDGHVALIQEPPSPFSDYTLQLRRVVPFASAFQGKLILHASAIRHPHGIVAFIGTSGVGKSTLAMRLSAQGYPAVSHDLLPCRIHDNKVVTPGERKHSLLSIYFLSRVAGQKNIRCEPLSRQFCLLYLLKHGFGELPEPRVWKSQFLGFHEIAARVPAFHLQLPDDLSLLDSSTAELLTHISGTYLDGPHLGKLDDPLSAPEGVHRAEFLEQGTR